MRTIVLLLFFWLCLAFSLWAEHVPAEKAQMVASSFLRKGSSGLRAGAPEIKLEHIAYLETPGLRSDGETAVGYYVYSAGAEGFVLVAGDDRAYPVLAYNNQGAWAMQDMPPNVCDWLNGYCGEIENLIRTNRQATATTRQAWADFSTRSYTSNAESRLLNTAFWGQGDPFNAVCPMQGDERCITGCVATGLGIVMNYYQWPKKGQGSHTYQAKELRRRITADFNVAYDWANMADDYREGWTDAQREAVSTLLYHCGVAVEMDYSPTSSNAGIRIDNIKKYFDYHRAARYLVRDSYTDKRWIEMLREELDKDRPVLYRGMNKDEGHVFVCDGYDNRNFFHMNWGWNGYWNGYFILSVLDPYEGNNGYHMGQGMVLDFVPSTHSAEVREDLRIGRLDDQGEGMVIEGGKIEKGIPFRLDVHYINNTGSLPFSGYIGLARVSQTNEILNLIEKFKWSGQLLPAYSGSCWFTTTLNDYGSEGDKLCLVYSNDQRDWQIIEGGTKTVNEIYLGEVKAKAYKINFPDIEGVTLTPLSGYDPSHVEAHKDFRFRLTLHESRKDWNVLVFSNGNLIISSGMYYSIEDIREDQDIRIVLTEPDRTSNASVTENLFRAFAQEGVIYIPSAPMNSRIEVYSASGKTIGSYLFTGSELRITPGQRGVFFIQKGKDVISIIN